MRSIAAFIFWSLAFGCRPVPQGTSVRDDSPPPRAVVVADWREFAAFAVALVPGAVRHAPEGNVIDFAVDLSFPAGAPIACDADLRLERDGAALERKMTAFDAELGPLTLSFAVSIPESDLARVFTNGRLDRKLRLSCH